jgi:hypothetical protein
MSEHIPAETLRWVPVTEVLPESGKKVLVAFKNDLGKGRRTCAEYIAPRTQTGDDFIDDTPDDWFDVDESGQSWVPEGWYETSETAEDRVYRSIPVTHWAPLLELPYGEARKPVRGYLGSTPWGEIDDSP